MFSTGIFLVVISYSKWCLMGGYRYVYTNGGNQAFMIKSNLGSGYVRNVVFDHFISRGTAYGLDVNQYWASQTPGSGAGVQLSNITFSVSLSRLILRLIVLISGLRRTGTGTSSTAWRARPSSSSARTARRARASRSRT